MNSEFTHEDELELLRNELRRDPAVRMEDIHPRMNEAQRQQALEEILRVLKGDA